MRTPAYGFSGVALLLALLCVAGAAAAPETTSGDDYRVQPGDTIQVRVWNDPNAPAREFTVNAEGNVAYPMVGVVSVKDRSVREIRERIVEELRKYVKDPVVTVDVVSLAAAPQNAVAAKRVYVLGSVQRPGPMSFAEGMRVVDAITQAGGFAPSADRAKAVINRGAKGMVDVDLAKFFDEGDKSQDLPLEADDILLVPARDVKGESINVLVVGQVGRPGSYYLPKEAKVMDAVAASMGPSPTAALDKATITRSALVAPLNLEALLREFKMEGNIALKDGDLITVPEGGGKITLLGEFAKAGNVPFRDGDKVLDAVQLGGGFTVAADKRAAVLRRVGREISVDLVALLNEGETQGNIPLQDGDTLFVPAGTKIYVYGAVGRPGPISVLRDQNLMEVLYLAGGPAPQANLAKAGVVRDAEVIEEPKKQGDAGKFKANIIELNLQDAFQKGTAPRNFLFAKGDVLYIPEKRKGFSWQGAMGTLYSLSLIGLNPFWLLR